ncbi:hypothetical protein [Blastococcus montanus]|uniref:hypothetical protein n=1 Tax=Blastococcus montanus TaxID=3144973 RepID=UPI00320826D5
MTAEPHADERAARPPRALQVVTDEPDRTRPNVSGDLPTVFQAAPMFRRTVAGYDRFQVDTYVQWAEEQLATADREREHLETRHLRALTELDEARELLAHSADGGEFLHQSRRVGTLLATAADEADSMRAEAAAIRSAAATEAERMVELAHRVLADAESEAERLVAEAGVRAAELAAEAREVVDRAELAGEEVRVEAAARLAEARAVEQRAAADAERIMQQARQEAAAARLHARAEAVRTLGTGRDERRRADAEAAADRDRLERECTALAAEVEALAQRRSALRAEVELLAGQVGHTSHDRPAVDQRGLLGRARSLLAR